MEPENKPKKEPVKWYLKPLVVLIAIAGVGPFAIPLIWISPELNKWQRVALTGITILFTLWTIKASVELYHILLREMQNLQSAMQ